MNRQSILRMIGFAAQNGFQAPHCTRALPKGVSYYMYLAAGGIIGSTNPEYVAVARKVSLFPAMFSKVERNAVFSVKRPMDTVSTPFGKYSSLCYGDKTDKNFITTSPTSRITTKIVENKAA